MKITLTDDSIFTIDDFKESLERKEQKLGDELVESDIFYDDNSITFTSTTDSKNFEETDMNTYEDIKDYYESVGFTCK